MQTKVPAEVKKQLERFNMVVNLFWSVLNLVPLSVFCYTTMDSQAFYIFLFVTLLTVLLPKKFFRHIQFSKTPLFYKKLGVKFINRFTQNGYFINRQIRKKYPEYKNVSASRMSVRKLIEQTYMFEKFHFSMFVFFMLTTVYALVRGLFWWSMIIALSNIIYNIYPTLLQQYIRVRLTGFKEQ